eukprot:912204-Alexandrium_andersonii.AAC.1
MPVFGRRQREKIRGPAAHAADCSGSAASCARSPGGLPPRRTTQKRHLRRAPQALFWGRGPGGRAGNRCKALQMA